MNATWPATDSSVVPPQWQRVPGGGASEFWQRRPDFSPGDVHVWHVDLMPDTFSRDTQLLSDDERQRGARLRFPHDQRRFAACRAALRRLLGDCLGEEPQSLRFESGAHGKPRLAGAGDLAFNVSHSRDSALLAIARGCEVGVDIEYIRENLDAMALAERFFAPGETEFLRRQPVDQRSRAFFEIWTLKEAWLKAAGVGLSGNFHDSDVSPWLKKRAAKDEARSGVMLLRLPPPGLSAPALLALAALPRAANVFLRLPAKSAAVNQ